MVLFDGNIGESVDKLCQDHSNKECGFLRASVRSPLQCRHWNAVSCTAVGINRLHSDISGASLLCGASSDRRERSTLATPLEHVFNEEVNDVDLCVLDLRQFIPDNSPLNNSSLLPFKERNHINKN